MPDPAAAVELLGLGAAARTVLGPSAREVGAALGRATEARLRNFGSVTEKAERKLGAAAATPGAVPPRVAAKILDEGSWCDDGVMQEYLAGVLAASRDTEGKNDEGVYWADLVSRLSGDHVRMHYWLYRALRDHGAGSPISLQLIDGQRARSVYLPISGLTAAVGDGDEAIALGLRTMPVLSREGLIGAEWGFGDADVLRFGDLAEGGAHAAPTHVGINLFLWAHGRPHRNLNRIVDPEYELPPFDEYLPPITGARVGPLLS